ncbi:MAG: biopolymer transporter ExbD [Rhodothermales bacterium]|nr:biopolymer transporter ExbD [Rhodothermales bacterium]MDG2015878.1 biopolymer transporter ExbD [Rhodothermales bacterium]HAY37804.1 biopolymer transporter ExbD [Bacteroidota bacterium]
MALLKKKGRREAEIPTSSMADIAFLLLIFFLVTTTIDVDTGIGMVLPPKLEDDVEPPPIKERNVLKILVNEQGMVLVEDQPSAVQLIRQEVVTHVMNEGADPRYAEAATKALVSIKTARETPYDAYVSVLDEVWMAYYEMWDNEARKLGYPDYKAYLAVIDANDSENEIKDRIKAAISIAEPDAA